MKTIYNNILDRASLPHSREGLRIYNNMLSILQGCHKVDRARLRRHIRMMKAKEVF